MRKVIVLGGYGLVGSACMRALARSGFAVTGVGRSRSAARASDPAADWLFRDLAAMDIDGWRQLVAGADIVVNASGALQNGLKDDLQAIHVTALKRLVEAAQGHPTRIVHISAAGARADASTEFFRSKARGDALLAASSLDWVILRPTLVLSPDAYGGTALLRGLSALPLILPLLLPLTQVQTVHVADVAAAVVAASRGEIPARTAADLTERGRQSFSDLVLALRRWQGFPDPVLRPRLPAAIVTLLARGADLLGYLGWRSPMRSTALAALADGIRGDPAVWTAVGGPACRPLAETLADLPSTRQERLFARLYLALPLAIATLALFWCLSGLIALFNPRDAMAVLTTHAVPAWAARLAVWGGAAADLALGLAILWRPWARLAALGMLGLTGLYLAGSLYAAPALWLDPLGPMVKVLPGAMLTAMAALMLEAR